MSQVNATSLKFSKKRDIISELTLSGLHSARMGRYRRRPSKDHKMVEGALKLHTSHQYNIKEITDMTGVSRLVLYRD
ncbi:MULTISPECIES: hypothetical protein [unclassified Peribacillus]|uniref:hypothetical protein n=1 Tax=unclassified Peribacillus TaxID=2675266 RepID=UPI001F5B5541|nr:MULTISPECIES: hypothetical protein [unclassified Peribacillus]WMX53848.1 hypothetical protein RE409_17380 [Peribacillus sp. R9-11]